MQNKLETTTLTQYTVYTKATAYKGLHIPDLLYITSYIYQGHYTVYMKVHIQESLD